MTVFEARSRWSMAVRCPRMGALALRGTESDPPDEVQQGYFRRGKQLQADVYESYRLQYGDENLIVEKPIPWPAGIAHGDIYVRPERLAVEVKSTASMLPLDHHLAQLAGQVEFDPDADRGLLILVNPSNLTRRPIPMPVVTDDMRDKVHQIADAVARSADPAAPLPDRVCQRPSEAVGRFCPFAAVCFHDWQPPDPIVLAPTVAALVADLDLADTEVRDAKDDLAAREHRRDTIRAELRKTLEPATSYLSPDDELVVQITEVAGRVTWDVKTAIETGVVDPAALEPFRKEGRGHERWRIRPALLEQAEAQDSASVLAGLTVEDFGDEAPF